MALVSGFEKIVRQQEPLAHRTWLRLGGPAEFFAEPNSVDELAALVRRCRKEEVPIRLLGGGSNILVRDEGVAGMVVSLSSADFSEIQITRLDVTAGGGASSPTPSARRFAPDWPGLEPLVGIPGTIGGALHGNSGSRGGDIGQWACRATVMTRAGEILQRNREDLVFAYRQSSLDELVILSGEFELEAGRSRPAHQADAEAVDRQEGGPAAVPSKRRLRLQESPRHERRHAHRASRASRARASAASKSANGTRISSSPARGRRARTCCD